MNEQLRKTFTQSACAKEWNLKLDREFPFKLSAFDAGEGWSQAKTIGVGKRSHRASIRRIY